MIFVETGYYGLYSLKKIKRLQQIDKSKFNFVDNVDESVSIIVNLMGLLMKAV